jgi:hypothetical protein
VSTLVVVLKLARIAHAEFQQQKESTYTTTSTTTATKDCNDDDDDDDDDDDKRRSLFRLQGFKPTFNISLF